MDLFQYDSFASFRAIGLTGYSRSTAGLMFCSCGFPLTLACDYCWGTARLGLRNKTICCAAVCYTRGPLEMFVQLHGMTALLLLQLLYAAAVNCCHNTYQRNTCHRPDCGERAAPCQRILPRPLPPLRSQNQCRVQRSVTGTRVQSNPSARSADLLIYILLTRVTKSYLLALGTTQISSFFTKH